MITMKKLDIIKGKYYTYKNRCFHEIRREGQYDEGEKLLSFHVLAQDDMSYGGTPQQEEDAAKLIADSLNTYQECELIPSELLEKADRLAELNRGWYLSYEKLKEQNKELREALEGLRFRMGQQLEHDQIKINRQEVCREMDIAEQALNSKP